MQKQKGLKAVIQLRQQKVRAEAFTEGAATVQDFLILYSENLDNVNYKDYPLDVKTKSAISKTFTAGLNDLVNNMIKERNGQISEETVKATCSLILEGADRQIQEIDNDKSMPSEKKELKKEVAKCLKNGVNEFMKNKGLVPMKPNILDNFLVAASDMALTFADYSDNDKTKKVGNNKIVHENVGNIYNKQNFEQHNEQSFIQHNEQNPQNTQNINQQ